jgi:hypothetical protein
VSDYLPVRKTLARNHQASPLSGVRFRDDPVLTDEAVESAHVGGWRPDENLEGLRRLRDSDRPEQRAQFEKLVAGHTRISLGDYETGLRAYLRAGGALPDGVAKP